MKDVFEVKEKDLAARVGTLQTPHGPIETPYFFPVVNPLKQPVSISKLASMPDCQGLMTNAYILWSRLREKTLEAGVHKLLGFNKVVATDSGGYQILEYGDVEVRPLDIVEFQQRIGTDIAVILDVPTGSSLSRKHAEFTVKETVRRSREASEIIEGDSRLWMGPVQGGVHFDLLQSSAEETAKLGFPVIALGSPTEIMEARRYDLLAEMIATARAKIPLSRPLHLFGAGHPLTIVVAAALGCDMFDSASYALYARSGRYMTPTATYRVDELDWFPCSCKVCQEFTPKEARGLDPAWRETVLAEHNLNVCFSEIRTVKHAIHSGRLWELLESRASSSPDIGRVFETLEKNKDFIERLTPISKPRSLLMSDGHYHSRPEVHRHFKKVEEGRIVPSRTLLILPEPQRHPASRYPPFKAVLSKLRSTAGVSVVFHSAIFGVFPLGVDEVYPLSQYESGMDDRGDIHRGSEALGRYIRLSRPRRVVAVLTSRNSRKTRHLRQACDEVRARLEIVYQGPNPWTEKVIARLTKAVLSRRTAPAAPS